MTTLPADIKELDGHCDPACPYLVDGEPFAGRCTLLNLQLSYYDYHLSECGRDQRAVRAQLEREACQDLTSLELERYLILRKLREDERQDRRRQAERAACAGVDTADLGAGVLKRMLDHADRFHAAMVDLMQAGEDE